MGGSEFRFINSLMKFQNLSPRVVKGIGDDAAVLALDARRYQLFTTDMCVEGVHFIKDAPARAVGWKAMAVNVSDIAAMGGLPTVAVVSIGIPKGLALSYVKNLYAGTHACAKAFNVSIVGGDTVRADKLVINVALLGEVEKKYLVTRDGVKAGDRIFVTGPLGKSLCSGRHLDFTPCVKQARFLVEHFKPSAMMDISDGLAGDLRHILAASGVGAVLDEEKIPRAAGATLTQALSDGEDFELLFTLSSGKARKLLEYSRRRNSLRFVEVGKVTAAPGKFLMKDVQGRLRPVAQKGFTHF
ncbi:MAG: thiamine-phosphate kinase [Candidatus Omnitrophota bacterium]